MLTVLNAMFILYISAIGIMEFDRELYYQLIHFSVEAISSFDRIIKNMH
jgi:hypothetical protein